MQRYEEFTEPIFASQNKRRYSTIYYPKFERRSSDKYIVTKRLQRLDLIAYQEYGDSRYWVILAKANTIPKGTLVVPPGFRLRIPYPLNSGEISELFRDVQF